MSMYTKDSYISHLASCADLAPRNDVLIKEYVITPDVFDRSKYDSDQEFVDIFHNLSGLIKKFAYIRCLRGEQWLSYIESEQLDGRWKNFFSHFLPWAKGTGMLRLVSSFMKNDPSNDLDWCREAIVSHSVDPLAEIFSSFSVVENILSEMKSRHVKSDAWKCFTSVQSLPVREDDPDDIPSFSRNMESFKRQLKTVMQTAGKVGFYDPHILPWKDGYGKFVELLLLAKNRSVPIKIEIHTRFDFEEIKAKLCLPDGGESHEQHTKRAKKKVEKQFQSWWSELKENRIRTKVFLWKYGRRFHNRCLLTNSPIAISSPAGFGTCAEPGAKDKWNILKSKEKKDIEDMFDVDENREHLWHKFDIWR